MTRQVVLVAHTGRDEARTATVRVAQRLVASGLDVRMLKEEAADLPELEELVSTTESAEGAEIILGLGGDGTLLRAAEAAHDHGVPVLGVNLGRVGFLAEVESDGIDDVVARVASRSYEIDERMTLDVTLTKPDGSTWVTWALNEIVLEKMGPGRMAEIVVEVDGQPLSRWGCDGVLVATPTGSTAYAFSVGGPIVWPDVQAILLVPIAAHALFARPIVTSPDSVLALEVLPAHASAALAADGRRSHAVPSGSRIEVVRGKKPVRLVRLSAGTFTDRLVRKFALPVEGWRGPGV